MKRIKTGTAPLHKGLFFSVIPEERYKRRNKWNHME